MSKPNVGVLVGLNPEPELEIKKVADLGLKSCQVCTWKIERCTGSTGEKLTAACRKHGVSVSTFWAGCLEFSRGPFHLRKSKSC